MPIMYRHIPSDPRFPGVVGNLTQTELNTVLTDLENMSNGFTPSGTFLTESGIIISYSAPNYNASNAYQTLYTDTDLDDLMTTVLAAGYKTIFVKTIQQTFTWTIDAIPENMIIESDDSQHFIIQTTSPDTVNLSVGAMSMLINLSVYDESGVDQGLSPNVPRPLGFFYNARTSAMDISTWERQYGVVVIGEPTIDRPGFGVGQFGIGDAIWTGVFDNGVGYRCDVCHNNPAKTGMGVYVDFRGAGKAIAAIGKTGATGDLIYLSPEVDLKAINITPTADTTTDIEYVTGIKTAGQMVNLYQGNSTFSGSGVVMNFGVGGAFSGNYLLCKKNNVAKISLQADGDMQVHDMAKGLVLADRSDGHTYRIKITNGVLGVDVVT